jgi:hypothetical protein
VLEKKHPDYEYTLLVRNEDKGKEVKARYPSVKLVYGSLDDSAVIEKAAAEADIVVRQYLYGPGHTSQLLLLTPIADTAHSADDAPSAKAIAKGIAAGHTAEAPGVYIHVCGTGLLTWVLLLAPALDLTCLD